MAKVYKKACYRPVPKNATIETTADGKQYAKWTAQNEPLAAELVETKNGPRIIQFSDVYIARYTDAGGKYIERSTGCKDRRAAEHVLSSWLQEVEKIKGGILTQENIDLGAKSRAGIDVLLDEYKEWQRSRGTTEKHIRNAFSQIEKVCKECKFKSASNLNAKDFSKWLTKKMKKNMGASTRNAYRMTMVAFANWLVSNAKCLSSNPFQEIPKANVKVDRRHKRRAMTPGEIVKLLEAAAERPVHDRLVITRGKNKGAYSANVSETEIAKAKSIGLERKLLYAALIYTGLRKNELASITASQVVLDHEIPHLLLLAKDAKTDEEAAIPICNILLEPLKKWLAKRKLDGSLKSTDKLFRVPDGLSKILERDLKHAGIAKRDSVGRVIDVHALRYTHGTLLMRSNIDVLVTQKSLRHTDVRMTSGIYTQRELDIVAEGVNRLPDFLNKTDDNETKIKPKE